MPLSGVRNSWLTVASKRDFASARRLGPLARGDEAAILLAVLALPGGVGEYFEPPREAAVHRRQPVDFALEGSLAAACRAPQHPGAEETRRAARARIGETAAPSRPPPASRWRQGPRRSRQRAGPTAATANSPCLDRAGASRRARRGLGIVGCGGKREHGAKIRNVPRRGTSAGLRASNVRACFRNA